MICLGKRENFENCFIYSNEPKTKQSFELFYNYCSMF